VDLWEKPCPFCPIVEGAAPAQEVERSDRHVAFVPFGPHVPGHVLFVPTRHLPDATVDPDTAGEVFAAAARYVAAATQSVPHLHVHVVPRNERDGLPARWPWVR
jgi:histidine triad (HIT) family protein